MTQFDTKQLRNAFGCFPSGVTIVTLKDEKNNPTGITVSSFSSLSLSPPLCLFSILALGRLCRSALLRCPFSGRWGRGGRGFTSCASFCNTVLGNERNLIENEKNLIENERNLMENERNLIEN